MICELVFVQSVLRFASIPNISNIYLQKIHSKRLDGIFVLWDEYTTFGSTSWSLAKNMCSIVTSEPCCIMSLGFRSLKESHKEGLLGVEPLRQKHDWSKSWSCGDVGVCERVFHKYGSRVEGRTLGKCSLGSVTGRSSLSTALPSPAWDNATATPTRQLRLIFISLLYFFQLSSIQLSRKLSDELWL